MFYDSDNEDDGSYRVSGRPSTAASPNSPAAAASSSRPSSAYSSRSSYASPGASSREASVSLNTYIRDDPSNGPANTYGAGGAKVGLIELEDEDEARYVQDYYNTGLHTPSPPMSPSIASPNLRRSRAKQLEEKRKRPVSGNTGVVMQSDSMPRPSSSHGVRSRPGTPLPNEVPSSPFARRTTGLSGSTNSLASSTSSIRELLDSKEREDSKESSAAKKRMSKTEAYLLQQGIKTTYDPADEAPKKPVVDLNRLEDFLFKAPPQGTGLIKCRIQRQCSGLDRLTPRYYVFLEETSKFCLSSRKRPSRTAHYLISDDLNNTLRESDHFVGKVRSNFTGTEFVIYDNGENPSNNRTTLNIRRELGAVLYESNYFGAKRPRKMTVLLPAIRSDGSSAVWRPHREIDGLVAQFNAQNLKDMLVLQSKQPVWDEESQSWALNFNGRVKAPSVKNFQLVSREDNDTVLMQFGRVNNEIFTMDFGYPLSLFQAFAICITSFDSKLACE